MEIDGCKATKKIETKITDKAGRTFFNKLFNNTPRNINSSSIGPTIIDKISVTSFCFST